MAVTYVINAHGRVIDFDAAVELMDDELRGPFTRTSPPAQSKNSLTPTVRPTLRSTARPGH